jgi:hypothetical protein
MEMADERDYAEEAANEALTQDARSELKITTNNVPRLLLDANQLTAAERAELDYLDWDKLDSGELSASFFRYRGRVYDLGEFQVNAPEGWDGIAPDSFFSAVVVRICPDQDYVVVGLALS